MNKQLQEPKGSRYRAIASTVAQNNNEKQSLTLVDNRPEAITQRKLQEVISKHSFQFSLNRPEGALQLQQAADQSCISARGQVLQAKVDLENNRRVFPEISSTAVISRQVNIEEAQGPFPGLIHLALQALANDFQIFRVIQAPDFWVRIRWSDQLPEGIDGFTTWQPDQPPLVELSTRLGTSIGRIAQVLHHELFLHVVPGLDEQEANQEEDSDQDHQDHLQDQQVNVDLQEEEEEEEEAVEDHYHVYTDGDYSQSALTMFHIVAAHWGNSSAMRFAISRVNEIHDELGRVLTNMIHGDDENPPEPNSEPHATPEDLNEAEHVLQELYNAGETLTVGALMNAHARYQQARGRRFLHLGNVFFRRRYERRMQIQRRRITQGQAIWDRFRERVQEAREMIRDVRDFEEGGGELEVEEL